MTFIHDWVFAAMFCLAVFQIGRSMTQLIEWCIDGILNLFASRDPK